MHDSKDILDRLLTELGDALERDRGGDNTFKTKVWAGLQRAQAAMSSSRDQVAVGGTLASGRSESADDEELMIAAHLQLRQVFRAVGRQQRRPRKLLA